MNPLFNSKDVIVVQTRFITLNIRDTIVLYDPRTKRTILKRIARIEAGEYFVLGDNKNESTDSRQFGWIRRAHILGKVIYPKK